MAQTEKSRPEPIVFDLNAAVTAAIGACGGDLVATVRSLVVANQFLLAQNEALSAELEEAWQLISPGFSRQKRTRRMRTGDPEEE